MKYFIAILFLITTVAAIVAAYVVMDKKLYHDALDGCYQAGRLEFTKPDETIANTPDMYWVKECMTKKGYEVN